jgi:hypothetical protein
LNFTRHQILFVNSHLKFVCIKCRHWLYINIIRRHNTIQKIWSIYKVNTWDVFIIYLEFQKQQQNYINYGYSTLTTISWYSHIELSMTSLLPRGNPVCRNRTKFLRPWLQFRSKLINYAAMMGMNPLCLGYATVLLPTRQLLVTNSLILIVVGGPLQGKHFLFYLLSRLYPSGAHEFTLGFWWSSCGSIFTFL